MRTHHPTRSLSSAVLLLGAGLLASCGDAAPPREIRRGPLPVGCLPPGYDAGPGCRLPGGRFCPAHASCPAPDGCNGCNCSEGPDGSLSARCTILGCTPRALTCDEVRHWDCQLPSGRWCRGGCIADDGCNTCQCRPDGTLQCTTRQCAGPASCHEDRDCPSGSLCVAAEPGCDRPLRCMPRNESWSSRWACLCDGTSTLVFGDPSRPFESFDVCPGYRSRVGDRCAAATDCGAGLQCVREGAESECTTLCSHNLPDCPGDAVCVTLPGTSVAYCRRRP